jgi:cbb3-type cytochrome oxidase maturation protein
MSIIYLVLPLALLVVAAGVVAFLWAARRGQYDDLDTPALRVLHDDDAPSALNWSPRPRRDPPGTGSGA